MSRVEKKVSANPKGSIRGIQPINRQRVVSHLDTGRHKQQEVVLTLGQFERETAFVELVLFDFSPNEVVNVSCDVTL